MVELVQKEWPEQKVSKMLVILLVLPPLRHYPRKESDTGIYATAAGLSGCGYNTIE